jgi:hypothetical protein
MKSWKQVRQSLDVDESAVARRKVWMRVQLWWYRVTGRR